MAVFFKNDCKFNGCGRTFPTLASLIEHIEATHIDFDPKVITEYEEQEPSGIPLSYVLKYSHCRHLTEINPDIKIRLLQHANKSFLGKHSGFVSVQQLELEESVSESESSNDSWTPTKESMLSDRKTGSTNLSNKDNKPFFCTVPGCKKRYKNINGIKYHYKNGHKIFEKPRKNCKQSVSKRNKEFALKRSGKKIFPEEAISVQIPSTSKATCTTSATVLATSAHYNDFKWAEDSIISEESTVLDEAQSEKIEKLIVSSSHVNNNNEFHAVCCSSAFINSGSQWSASLNSVAKNELTIVRSPMQNNDLPNNFINYLDFNVS